MDNGPFYDMRCQHVDLVKCHNELLHIKNKFGLKRDYPNPGETVNVDEQIKTLTDAIKIVAELANDLDIQIKAEWKRRREEEAKLESIKLDADIAKTKELLASLEAKKAKGLS